jgi:hypothetical protein
VTGTLSGRMHLDGEVMGGGHTSRREEHETLCHFEKFEILSIGQLFKLVSHSVGGSI